MKNMHSNSWGSEDTIDGTVREKATQKSTWVSVAVNLFLTIMQITVGLFARSQALVADGVHSLSDLLADFVVLLASHHSRKDADNKHPYGHYRYENGASLALGLLLLVVGAGMIFNSIDKFNHPESIQPVHQLALWIAIGCLICKESLFRYMLSVAQKVKSSMLVANAWHARSDAASSLVVAMGIVGNLAGYPILDPVAALVVGLMISKTGVEFSWSALSDLMDRGADDEELSRIRETIISTCGVHGIHDLRSRKVGDLIWIDVHLEISGQLSVAEGHEIAIKARNNVLEHHQVLNVMIHVDPI